MVPLPLSCAWARAASTAARLQLSERDPHMGGRLLSILLHTIVAAMLRMGARCKGHADFNDTITAGQHSESLPNPRS